MRARPRGLRPLMFSTAGKGGVCERPALLCSRQQPDRPAIRRKETSRDRRHNPDCGAGWVQKFSASAAGVVAFWDHVTVEPAALAWVDRSGKPLGSIGQPAYYSGVVLSPRGDAIAATFCDSIDCQDPTNTNFVRRYNLRILTTAGGSTAVTNDEAVAATPVWSQSGTELVYGSTRGGHMDLYRRNLADGTERTLIPPGVDRGATAWSPDGRYIAYTELRPDTAFDIWIVDVKTGKRAIFRGSKANETMAAFSPDGRWIAYASDDSGSYGIYIAPFSAGGGLKRNAGETVRIAGLGFLPLWREDGAELFYYSGMDVMAVNIANARNMNRDGSAPAIVLAATRVRNGQLLCGDIRRNALPDA